MCVLFCVYIVMLVGVYSIIYLHVHVQISIQIIRLIKWEGRKFEKKKMREYFHNSVLE